MRPRVSPCRMCSVRWVVERRQRDRWALQDLPVAPEHVHFVLTILGIDEAWVGRHRDAAWHALGAARASRGGAHENSENDPTRHTAPCCSSVVLDVRPPGEIVRPNVNRSRRQKQHSADPEQRRMMDPSPVAPRCWGFWRVSTMIFVHSGYLLVGQ